jgi:hypothetical protein
MSQADLVQFAGLSLITAGLSPLLAESSTAAEVVTEKSSMKSSILDRFEVAELIGRYADSLNHRDWDRYTDCWIEEGVFKQTIANQDEAPQDQVTTIERPISLEARGRDAIVKLVSAYKNYKWSFQLPTGIVVTMNGETEAQIRHVLYIRTNSLTLLGICYDRATKGKDGVWRLSQRDYRPSYFERSAAPGILCRELPDPQYRHMP